MHIPLLRFDRSSGLNHRVVRLFLVFFFILTVPGTVALAYPEGELYWATENYPEHTFPYDTNEPYNGAVAAIDYGCLQYAGNGTYTGTVRILESSVNFPAEKAGYCRVTRPFVPELDGALYYAYLYCNGEQREQMDDYSPCESPAPTLDKNKNLGQPRCP